MTATRSDAFFSDRSNPHALILIGDPSRAEEAAAALDAAGGRLVATVAIDDAADALQAHRGIDLVLVEAQGADPEQLARALDALAHEEPRPTIIVALDIDQIDLVAARLLTGRVQLLCNPSAAERVGAIVLGLSIDGTSAVKERDSEAERLRRLNEEVARIAESLVRLTRAEASAARDMVGDRSPGYGAAPSAMPEIRAEAVRQVIRARRLRDRYFAGGLFGDPAWDMLLDLFAADLERAQVSVSSLCIAAAVAPTTALRWIARMTEEGLFDRSPDPFDRRRAYMVLTPTARTAMQGYWATAQRLGSSSI